MGGENISIQYLKALQGEIVWDMSSILSVDHHRCAMQGMSMGQVLNVQNVIVQETILDNDGKKNQDKSHRNDNHTDTYLFAAHKRLYSVV